MNVARSSNKFSRTNLAIVLAVVALYVPFVVLLFGRNFEVDTVDSTLIINSSYRQIGAVVSFGSISVALLLLSRGLRFFTGRGNPMLKPLLLLTFFTVAFALAIGVGRGNPLGYVMGDTYQLVFPILCAMTGLAMTRQPGSERKVLALATFVYVLVVGYETSLSLLKLDTLYIRYGSGVALALFPLVFIFGQLSKNRLLVGVLMLTLAFYVLASGSRGQLAILVFAALTMFLRTRQFGIVMSMAVGLAMLVGLTFFAALIQILSEFLLSFDVSRTMGIRLGQAALLFDTSISLENRLDASLLGRLYESESVVGSLSGVGWLIGSGFGATFDNSRALISNVANDHYIHITPMLLLFRLGVLGAVLYMMFMLVALKSLWGRREYAFAVGFIFIALLFKFGLASGAFFPQVAVALFLAGLLSRNEPIATPTSRQPVPEKS
jgi:hypothetical protein